MKLNVCRGLSCSSNFDQQVESNARRQGRIKALLHLVYFLVTYLYISSGTKQVRASSMYIM